jgi:PadR family transcriptional regulator PadR
LTMARGQATKPSVGGTDWGASWIGRTVADLKRGGCQLGYMLTRKDKDKAALLQGTLDMLILRMLKFGPNHGQGIARAIEQQSENVLLVDHGAVYPAPDRLETRGWITAKWGTSSKIAKPAFTRLLPKSGTWK